VTGGRASKAETLIIEKAVHRDADPAAVPDIRSNSKQMAATLGRRPRAVWRKSERLICRRFVWDALEDFLL
jgi:hypothetical protein